MHRTIIATNLSPQGGESAWRPDVPVPTPSLWRIQDTRRSQRVYVRRQPCSTQWVMGVGLEAWDSPVGVGVHATAEGALVAAATLLGSNCRSPFSPSSGITRSSSGQQG